MREGRGLGVYPFYRHQGRERRRGFWGLARQGSIPAAGAAIQRQVGGAAQNRGGRAAWRVREQLAEAVRGQRDLVRNTWGGAGQLAGGGKPTARPNGSEDRRRGRTPVSPEKGRGR